MAEDVLPRRIDSGLGSCRATCGVHLVLYTRRDGSLVFDFTGRVVPSAAFPSAIYFVYRAVRISFAYSNPRIQLTLAPGQDQSPKEKLAWTITEGARAPRSLKLRLVGKHFHHVDGTTRQKKFFEKEVANVSDRTIKSGEVEFDVPQDVLLQSFDGEDKVGWFVVAELKFVNWPGSKVEFRIVTKESTEMLHSPPPTQI